MFGFFVGIDEVDLGRIRLLIFITISCLVSWLFSHSYYPMILYDLLDDESQVAPRTYILPGIYISIVTAIVLTNFATHLKMKQIIARAERQLVRLRYLKEDPNEDDEINLQCQFAPDYVALAALPLALSIGIFLAIMILFDLGFGAGVIPKFWLVFLNLALKVICASIGSTVALSIAQPSLRVYYLKQFALFAETVTNFYDSIPLRIDNFLLGNNAVAPRNI